MSNINPPPQNFPGRLAIDGETVSFFKRLLRSIYLIFQRVRYIDTNTVKITSGTGTPESAVTGNVGDVFIRTDGGASTVLYVKESGTGNTGWVAK